MSADLWKAPGLELWGGVECTVTRVRDGWRDQMAETGHWNRIQDLDAVAALGIRTLRYPVLWEHVSPDSPERTDWRWHDARLERLRDLGIRPIAGLVHHGGGPRYTSLVDPAFPEMLAVHAGRVAERYPWLEMFTPVNEPLTTARFANLYGHWHPHNTDHGPFLRSLVIECKATLLAMRAIGRTIPGARLIQTEDMGKVFSVPSLKLQADHENGRRWLSLDLLCGRVDRDHPWWRAFLDAGVDERDLDLLRAGEGAPDIIGINHYLTSERYLDPDQARYPEHLRSRDPRHPYADAEAVRMDWPVGDTGPEARLREVWERYRRPVAVTEAHHGCTREEQVRWLMEVWSAAGRLRGDGVDLRAVTVWSLFGAIDWNSLLTRRDGFYEPGPFDVRSDPPRPTLLATAVGSLAATGGFDHPVLDRAGWWHRPMRLYRQSRAAVDRVPCAASPRRLLITGATGTLGRALARACGMRGLDHVLVGRRDMDIADPDSVNRALDDIRPWAVVNAAGFVRVADAERERARCFRENTTGAATLAGACAQRGLPLATFSTDMVFDGRLGRPYREDDPVSPTGAYGASKAEAERLVARLHPEALILRTAAFFGPWDVHNFVHATLCGIAAGRTVSASADIVSPTYVPDLANATLDLLMDGTRGIWHLAHRGAASWYDFARTAAKIAGLGPARVRPVGGSARNTALQSGRGALLPCWQEALARCIAEPGPIRDILGTTRVAK